MDSKVHELWKILYHQRNKKSLYSFKMKNKKNNWFLVTSLHLLHENENYKCQLQEERMKKNKNLW